MAKSLKIGDLVMIVPKNKDSLLNHEFSGRIIGFKDEFIQVIDSESDVFDLDKNEVMGYEDY